MVTALFALSVVFAQFPDPGDQLVLDLRATPTVQLNGKFSQHAGTRYTYAARLRSGFGLRLTFDHNWVTQISAFDAELIRTVREEARAATGMVLPMALFFGAEVTPARGMLWESVPFEVVLDGGVGRGWPAVPVGPPSRMVLLHVEPRVAGSAGLTARIDLRKNARIIAEVRTVFFPSYIHEVEGCTTDDLWAINGRPQSPWGISATCNSGAFSGSLGSSALVLGTAPETDIINILSAGLGLSIDLPL